MSHVQMATTTGGAASRVKASNAAHPRWRIFHERISGEDDRMRHIALSVISRTCYLRDSVKQLRGETRNVILLKTASKRKTWPRNASTALQTWSVVGDSLGATASDGLGAIGGGQGGSEGEGDHGV